MLINTDTGHRQYQERLIHIKSCSVSNIVAFPPVPAAPFQVAMPAPQQAAVLMGIPVVSVVQANRPGVATQSLLNFV